MPAPLGRAALVVAALACGLGGSAQLAQSASAVTVTRGELENGQLLVQGRGTRTSSRPPAPRRRSPARADLTGEFTIQASGFSAPDCKVVGSDRQTVVATVTLSGCTPAVVPLKAPAPHTGSCVVDPQPAPASLTAGTGSAVYSTTTGCDASSVLSWSVVAGVIRTGMTGPGFQGPTAGNIIGTPTVPGTYRFTPQAVDPAGASDRESSVVVAA